MLYPRLQWLLHTLLMLLIPGLMVLCIGHCTVHTYAMRSAHQHQQHQHHQHQQHQHHQHQQHQHHQHQHSDLAYDTPSQLPLLDYQLLELITLSLLPPTFGLLTCITVIFFLLLIAQRADQIRPRPLLPPPRAHY